ncbi:flagellar export protein FliJ [Novipirellula artificiosorum]|uniref:Flagellar FliJ protein n=1 Tax=Novipirellula artificiosorum TaxID=2528016 RepID=A0A5C6DZ95_9BACT|nr:flagellar export protein FliJ [Novipirellula artificiosorum]TWU41745.1 flagellar biosynthesis chaperone [Novipirellula artificiosorum]
MKFEFRFASILHLRCRQRDEAGGKVGEANAAIAKIDSQIESIQEERRTLTAEDASSRVGEVSVDRLLTKGRYDLQLQADIKSLRETRSKLVEELERRQVKLKEAETEVKKFERMQEIELKRYRGEMLRREQVEMDELNNRRTAMARHTSS